MPAADENDENNYQIPWAKISEACHTAEVSYEKTAKVAPNRWVVSKSPARIDFAGDDLGSSVELDVAVCQCCIEAMKLNFLNTQCPIGAKARRISTPEIRLTVSSSFDHRNETYHQLTCTTLEDFDNHSDPCTPCALLKACIVYAGIVEVADKGKRTLQELLARTFDDGLGAEGIELHAWSSLPQGTGLGCSSILAGTILAALGVLVGRKYDMQSLVHAVLHVEQIFTTEMPKSVHSSPFISHLRNDFSTYSNHSILVLQKRWWLARSGLVVPNNTSQPSSSDPHATFCLRPTDQIGGFLLGVKLSSSDASLPLRVTWSNVELPAGFMELLESRLLLVYTGHSRLAKNLLRNVVGHWERRSDVVVKTFDALVSEAEEQAVAFQQGSLSTIGRLLTSYFAHKRHLSSTTLAHPPLLSPLLSLIEPHAYGYALSGAGGGGFLVVVLKEETDRNALVVEIKQQFGEDEVVWDVKVDRVGLTVEVLEAGLEVTEPSARY
ncbi:GHMP kinase [Jimgerdemannia flammicorona]|uniref:GHMP kinase n=1 Tax=Jimgerdemannia flammicorona TaxID=994334 RepID=A0A433QLV2_9FUNG|nr:GHMP kinase [Jimgerdemannia flammicorona]